MTPPAPFPAGPGPVEEQQEAAVQWVEIEVEVVRRETIQFSFDPTKGIGTQNQPNYEVGYFSRALTYWMHHVKDLAKREQPRLISWRFLSSTCDEAVGERASWMSPDQFDPSRCRLPRNHDGPHEREHPAASRVPASGEPQ